MHLLIFLVLGPLLGLATAMYVVPPLYGYMVEASAISRAQINVNVKIGLPSLPIVYALGFFPALSASRLDHALHEMQIAAPLRAGVTAASAMLGVIVTLLVISMTMPFLGVLSAAVFFAKPATFLLLGLLGFLPGLVCSLPRRVFWTPPR